MSEERATEARHRRFLETLLENATVCVAVVAGQELRFTLVNPAYQRLRPDLPLVGRTHPEAFPEAFEAQAVLRRVLQTGEPHEANGFRMPIPGKPDAAWDHRVAPLPPADGEEPAALVMAWDVTERERDTKRLQVAHDTLRQLVEALRESEARLRESEQRFKTMADTAPAMLWITDASHLSTFISRGWLDFTGQTLEEALGMGWVQPVFEEDRGRVEQAYLEAAARGESFQLDYRLRRADGELRWVVDSGRPRFDAEGHFLGYIGSVIDVHERKRAEQELQRLNAELSDESRRKDEFLATLAHELRNPLAPLRNSLELMKRARDNPAVVEKARATMERQLVQMVRLVDDLLDVSRISRDRLELQRERVDLASIVESALELCRPLCERAGHSLSVALPPEPVSLFADPVRLAQVFGNLLTNACKYTEPGGRIRLSAERQGTDVVVTVEDNGVGIPPDMLSRVFDLFTQVDRSLQRSGGGLGIGLSLVKRLVGMHGGTVTAHSEGPGRGSTFVVRLPVLPS